MKPIFRCRRCAMPEYRQETERHVEFLIQNKLPDLWALQKKIRILPEYVRLDEQRAYLLDLVLEEMISNIIKYGYDDGEPHEISVSLAFTGSTISVRLEDDGHPFDPLRECVPESTTPLEQRCIGGLGILLVRNMAGDVVYRRENGRNILEILIVRRQGEA